MVIRKKLKILLEKKVVKAELGKLRLVFINWWITSTMQSNRTMERLPEMFSVIRPGYRYMYISLCKNTIEKRKQRQYQDAPLDQPRRYSYVDIDCNMLEFVQLHGSYDTLVRDDHVGSLYELKKSMVGWKNSSFQRRERHYYVLPFILCYNGDTYPVISFSYTSWLSSRDKADYKFLLRDHATQAIKLALHVLDPRMYNHPDAVIINQDEEALQAALQDDVKESEPVPNKLPTFVIENHMNYEIARSECPIASIGLKECDRVSMLDCYHLFDSSSIHTWMRIKAECPVCKSKSIIIHTLSVSKSIPSQSVSSAPSDAPKKKMEANPTGEIIGFTDTVKDDPVEFEKQLDKFIWLSKKEVLHFNQSIVSLQDHPIQFLPAAYGPNLERLFHIKQKLETKHRVHITIDHKWLPGTRPVLRRPGQPFYHEIDYINLFG